MVEPGASTRVLGLRYPDRNRGVDQPGAGKVGDHSHRNLEILCCPWEQSPADRRGSRTSHLLLVAHVDRIIVCRRQEFEDQAE